MTRALLALLVMLAACDGDETTATTETRVLAPPADAVTRPTEVGPVKATVKVWPAKPRLGESIYLRLEVDAPAGIRIEAPFQDAGDARLGRFRIVGFLRDVQDAANGGQRHEQTYTLEAQTSGKHRVPPLRLEMFDNRDAMAGAAAQEILTDEIPLDIAPVDAAAAGQELRPALGELDPVVGGTPWILVLGIASGTMIMGAGGILLWRSVRARRKREQQRNAYEEAVAQLRELEHRGAPDVETADAWFVALSAIVRRYLEHRYDIRAPELTTEEFLNVATARPELREEHRDLLRQFLERCDRVKFAGYRPDAEESLATLAAARGFVEDTRARAMEAAA